MHSAISEVLGAAETGKPRDARHTLRGRRWNLLGFLGNLRTAPHLRVRYSRRMDHLRASAFGRSDLPRHLHRKRREEPSRGISRPIIAYPDCRIRAVRRSADADELPHDDFVHQRGNGNGSRTPGAARHHGVRMRSRTAIAESARTHRVGSRHSRYVPHRHQRALRSDFRPRILHPIRQDLRLQTEYMRRFARLTTKFSSQ